MSSHLPISCLNAGELDSVMDLTHQTRKYIVEPISLARKYNMENYSFLGVVEWQGSQSSEVFQLFSFVFTIGNSDEEVCTF